MFDSIPEDTEPSFPCACGGNVTQDKDGSWTCDTCEFVRWNLS